MPTIEQLPTAIAASDTDEIVASQGGIVRSVTRAQLVAGLQPELTMTQGTLLGRASAGIGGAEPIAVGANLVLGAGVLSAAAPFAVGALPSASGIGATDLVPVGQRGANTAISYGAFMAGLGAIPGVDASQMTARPSGGSVACRIADLLGASLPVEAFGATGDGATDDTAAFVAAVASGRPVRLGPRTYVANGQWNVSEPAVLLGVPGASTIRRLAQSGDGAWIDVQGASFLASGIVFDANRAGVSQESWGVLVSAGCTRSTFIDCCFLNAQGPTLGNGLTLLASDPANVQHVVRGCEAAGNAAHGIWVQAVDGVQLLHCRTHDNVGYGISVDYAGRSTQQARNVQLLGCESWNNARGIAVGDFNQGGSTPPVWGNGNPHAVSVLVAGNNCHDNAVYGIAVSGSALSVEGNLLSDNGSTGNGGGGILANVSHSRVANNMVTGAGQFGIDSGGSQYCDIAGNYVRGAAIGLNPGGSQNVRVAGNHLEDNGWGITLYNVETDGAGNNFGLAAGTISIAGNWIGFSSASGGGVYLLDAPQGVRISDNDFVGTGSASTAQAIWAHTDAVIVERNRWNNTQRFICNPVGIGGLQTVQVPDCADGAMITSAPAGVQSIMTQHQVATLGQVTFVKVTAGGAGYTHATVKISGAGSGASAIAYVSNGAVIGIALTAAGSGYGGIGASASVTIAGDGQGATAVASVGLPVPEERRLLLSCNTATRFARAGSSPLQENWTLYDITVPANAAVSFVGTWGAWRAVAFPPADYLSPNGDGSALLRTAAGDLTLHPAGSGRVRLASDAEPVGCTSSVGRGPPTGQVSAPPGSDYRNLDGGAGSTFWIKQSASDATGWLAVA